MEDVSVSSVQVVMGVDEMKKKYLMICFHHVYSWFNSNLTDKQQEKFYEHYPRLTWMKKSEKEMDNHLNAVPIPTLEVFIKEIIEHCAKHNDKWTKERLAGSYYV